jgi:hypothetical protein
MEEDIMRMRMRILRSLRKLVIAYTKNEIKTTATTMTPIILAPTLSPTHIHIPTSPHITVPNTDAILLLVLV